MNAPHQLHNLETYVLRLQARKQWAKQTCKVLLAIFMAALITSLVFSLTSCGIYRQHIEPHALDYVEVTLVSIPW
jgi:hypothetical protein